MEISAFTAPLRRLVDHLRAWDETSGSLPDSDDAGLSHAARTALLDELHDIVGDDHDGVRARPGGAWQALRGVLGGRASTPAAERARREHDLLRGYEQLCELDLPFHLSSVLLRHYSLIKRAVLASDGLLQGPPRRAVPPAAAR